MFLSAAWAAVRELRLPGKTILEKKKNVKKAKGEDGKCFFFKMEGRGIFQGDSYFQEQEGASFTKPEQW